MIRQAKAQVFLVSTLVALLVLGGGVSADVPHLLNVQGLLTDAGDQPLADGSYSIEFALYNTETGGTVLWSETRSVATAHGLFTLYLGQVNPLPASVFSASELWLGIAVEGEAEMMPRQRLAAVPYVFRAISSDSSSFAFSVADNSIGSEQIVDGSIELADLGQNGAATDQVIKWNGSAWTPADDESGSGGADGWTDDGSVVRLVNGDDEVGIGTQFTDEKLHVESKAYEGRAFLQLETSHYFNWGECGMRFVTPANRWHLRMDDYTKNNLPIPGSLALRSQNSGKEVMTWTDDGDVGIGDTTPDAKLDVTGDLQLAGAFRGLIGSSSGSDGAPFPRPAYNSGWLQISQGEYKILTHNIGGDRDDYVVDLQFKDTAAVGLGVNIKSIGGNTYRDGVLYHHSGGYYEELTSTTIKIHRWEGDWDLPRVRVRIWVIK